MHSVSKEPGWISLGNYHAVRPTNLAEIPDTVRLRLLSHLRSRLGDTFVERLRFTGGQIVDLERLRQEEPDSKDYQWEIHAYDLHFEFRMPNVGIRSYTAQIRLRSDGSVLEEIDLPAFSSSPEKLNVFPLSKAISVATNHGFARKDIYAEIMYFKDADSLVWWFQEPVSDDGSVIESKNIYVSAHDGTIIKSFSSVADR